MKVPTIFALMVLTALLVLGGLIGVTSSVSNLQASAAQPDHVRYGVVMGRDFTSLLADPNVQLKVTEANGTVAFVWTSESPARLAEIRELGQYMETAKLKVEAVGPWLDPMTARHANTIGLVGRP